MYFELQFFTRLRPPAAAVVHQRPLQVELKTDNWSDGGCKMNQMIFKQI